MIISCKAKELFAPIVTSLATISITDSAPSTSPETHRDLNYFINTAEASHNEYLVEGINLSNSSVTPSDQIDDSQFPLLRRASGFTGVSSPVVDNGRASTDLPALNFGDTGSAETVVGPMTRVSGSYAEFSYNVVSAIAANIADNRIISGTAPHYRVNSDTFPHMELTGLVWSSGSPISGRKFAAVTRRHVVGCGHYGNLGLPANNKLYFLTVGNVVIERTIIGEFNLFTEGSGYDLTIYVLNSDLPESIIPLPVMGTWFYKIISSSASGCVACPQVYGLVAFGNDGHFAPSCPIVFRNDVAITYYKGDFYSIGMDGTNSNFPVFSSTAWVYENSEWSTLLLGGKFYHNLRGGDSGSPLIYPIADGGWGFATPGYSSSNGAFTEAIWNNILAIADARAGISTGYTVTVAPDPTL
jgi:hypothetical protein